MCSAVTRSEGFVEMSVAWELDHTELVEDESCIKVGVALVLAVTASEAVVAFVESLLCATVLDMLRTVVLSFPLYFVGVDFCVLVAALVVRLVAVWVAELVAALVG